MAHANTKQNYRDESTQLKGQLNEVKMKLSQASTALRHAERRIDREINHRKLLISDMERSYKSKIEILENALHSFYPESYQCHDSMLKSPSIIPNVKKPIVPSLAKHIDVEETMRKLDQLVDRLNSDSEDEKEVTGEESTQ
ncbi:unnamed protein product [Trichobilharzia regenti]|nr:unnamed protein product [Trichobilharzia regenti]